MIQTTQTALEQKRQKILDRYRQKQPFRASIGKSKWIDYTNFNPDYNLREILNDEICVEFDTKNEDLAWKGINFTAINLYQAGYIFQIWDHGGKSPHLHVHDLPITQLEPDKRRLFKKIFIRKYVPLEYLKFVDYSLTGIHLIAIEWVEHWKGCYGVKELLYEFDPLENQNETLQNLSKTA